jgi:hypothetical protein
MLTILIISNILSLHDIFEQDLSYLLCMHYCGCNRWVVWRKCLIALEGGAGFFSGGLEDWQIAWWLSDGI